MVFTTTANILNTTVASHEFLLSPFPASQFSVHELAGAREKSNKTQVHCSSADSVTCGELFVMSGDSLPQKHLVMCPSMTVPLTETIAWAALSWLENLQDKQGKAQSHWSEKHYSNSVHF